jgi:hypothetical protein
MQFFKEKVKKLLRSEYVDYGTCLFAIKRITTASSIKNNEEKNSRKESYAYMYAHVEIRYEWKREATNKYQDCYLAKFCI